MRPQSHNDSLSGSFLSLVIIVVLRCYKWVISPLKNAIFGGVGCCRFSPTCSSYAIDAFSSHRFWRACKFVFKRIIRCHPWGGSGYDPVPCQANESLSTCNCQELTPPFHS